MTFFDAVNRAKDGATTTIVSYAGNRYTSADPAPIQCGRNWAIIASTSGMTEKERKGAWAAE
ncbi:hypothetical protein [Paenibacillus sp. SI8]|uniref:hypothetical protein n=1 Tax=unclassified Paenibacillus TaxID=185978 RepID=UPI003466F3FA